MFLKILTSYVSNFVSTLTIPKGVNQGISPSNRFLENCYYVFEDIDFYFFAIFLTLAQVTVLFSEPFDLPPPPPPERGKSGVTPLEIGFWWIAAMGLDIDLCFFAMFLASAKLSGGGGG